MKKLILTLTVAAIGFAVNAQSDVAETTASSNGSGNFKTITKTIKGTRTYHGNGSYTCPGKGECFKITVSEMSGENGSIGQAIAIIQFGTKRIPVKEYIITPHPTDGVELRFIPVQ